MNNDYSIPAEVVKARENAQALTKTAGTTAAAEPLVSDILRQKVFEAYAQNQDVIQPLDTATQNYLQAPQTAREKYQGVFNPFSREKLVSQYVGNMSKPMLTYSSIYGNRMGRIEDTLGAGTNAFKSQVLARQAEAQAANDLYDTLLSEYVATTNNKFKDREQTLAEQKYQSDLELELAKLALNGYGGNGGLPDGWGDWDDDGEIEVSQDTANNEQPFDWTTARSIPAASPVATNSGAVLDQYLTMPWQKKNIMFSPLSSGLNSLITQSI